MPGNNIPFARMNPAVPAIMMDDVKNVHLFKIKAQPVAGTDNIILKNVETFSIEASEGYKDKKIKQTVSSSL